MEKGPISSKGEIKIEKEFQKKEVILPKEDQISETMAKITDLADQSKVELIFSLFVSVVLVSGLKNLRFGVKPLDLD